MNYPACLCLQETRQGDRLLRPPAGYKIIQSQQRREDESERGVCMLINKKIHHEELPLRLSGNVEAVAAKLWLGRYYTVCSLYLSPSQVIQETDITNLIDQLNGRYLLLGDMNAHHGLWGEPTENRKGKIFADLLLNQDITLLNDNQKTHYSIQHDTSTLIDLSIASPTSFPDFTASVVECRHGSDHHPIKIQKLATPEIGEPSLRFKIEKADWQKFEQMTSNYNKPQHDLNINERVDHLTNYILEAARASIPVSGLRNNGKIPLPWWSDECNRVHAERKRAQRTLHRNYSNTNAIAVRRLNALCRRTFKKAKKESWIRYVSTINVNTTLSEIWKKINKIRGKFSTHPPPLLRDEDGTLTDNPKETSILFAEAFSDVSSEDNYTTRFRRHKGIEESKSLNFSLNQNPRAPYNEPFTMKELLNVLSATKETSPGIDRITYSMIKKAHHLFHQAILDLINEIFTTNVFPTPWRIAEVIPIPKPNKDHSTPTNFRPISLTSCLCKIFEKMLNHRLVWFLEREKCLNNIQSGFKRGRSTTDCLVQLTCDVQQAIIDKNHTIAVFFDLQKAYDTAWKRGILNKLYQFGLRGHLPTAIVNFLTNRQIKVRIGSTYSEARDIEEGVPQGSVLSCTLFAIAIDDVIDCLPLGVKATLYVDDLTIYASGTKNMAERQISLAIKRLETWCNRTGFQFSAQKTVSMHICRVRKCSKPAPRLDLNGSFISSKETHTYLGLLLDNSLRWHKHIEKVRYECMRRLNVLKHLSHTAWGADSKTLLRLYSAFIKPKLEYGVEAYGSSCISNLKKLNPIQNSALRLSTGAYRTSPIDSLEVISGIISLDASRKEKLAKYIVRVVANPGNPLNKIISIGELILEEDEENHTKFKQQSVFARAKLACKDFNLEEGMIFPEGPMEDPPWKTDNIYVCEDIIRNAKRSIPENTLKMIFTNHLQSHMEDNLLIYTDGSKTKDGTAFSIVGYEQNRLLAAEVRKLRDCTSIFSAELYAILLAVRKSQRAHHQDITIVSDSKSSIQAISQLFSKNPLVTLIQEQIQKTNKRYHLCWVPSHVGVSGNERADRAANDATKCNSHLEVSIPKGDIHAQIKKISKAEWLKKWQSTRINQNKFREVTNNLSPLAHSTCEDRKWERTLTRLRLGHSRLTHSYLMSGGAPPSCDNCGEDVRLTIKHLLVECPAHRTARIRFFNSSSPTMTALLKERDTSPGGSLEKFINAIDIINLL